MRILITGGTVFVSKFVSEYFAGKGNEVFVLNRGSKAQPLGCYLIKADRNYLGDALYGKRFDAVLDITAYSGHDVHNLFESGIKFSDYILLSSSAVYPEKNQQPFFENQPVSRNRFWNEYGLNKIEAEREAMSRFSSMYIVRPPYLYGPGNNVYREAFVFECAELGRKFYLPKNGTMKLQLFYIEDLCRIFENILKLRPANHVINVGNKECVSVKKWVELCYQACGRTVKFVEVHADINQRDYFPFYDYEYALDVQKQDAILERTTELKIGVQESYAWYSRNKSLVNKKNYIDFIDRELRNGQ